MTRRLISDNDRIALTAASGDREVLSAERERIRLNTNTPLTWRLCPSFTAFYDPAGMTAAEIATYDQAEIDAVATTCPSPDLLAVIAGVAECCNISETDVRARVTRHLRRIHRKANGL